MSCDLITFDGLRLISVTKNLHSALELSHPFRTHMLCVDSRSIDQGNFEERGEQVGKMSSIYSSGRSFITWFGEWDKQVEVAFSLLGSLKRYPDPRNAVRISRDCLC
jgi:hypothetical protein